MMFNNFFILNDYILHTHFWDNCIFLMFKEVYFFWPNLKRRSQNISARSLRNWMAHVVLCLTIIIHLWIKYLYCMIIIESLLRISFLNLPTNKSEFIIQSQPRWACYHSTIQLNSKSPQELMFLSYLIRVITEKVIFTYQFCL